MGQVRLRSVVVYEICSMGDRARFLLCMQINWRSYPEFHLIVHTEPGYLYNQCFLLPLQVVVPSLPKLAFAIFLCSGQTPKLGL